MPEATPEPAAPALRSTVRQFSFPLSALLLAAIVTVLCRATAGVSLGLFFGAVAFVTLLVPPFTAGEDGARGRALIPCAVTLGTALAWLTALGDRFTFAQWLACSGALLAYTFALCGLCSLLTAIRFNNVIAAAAVVALGMLWLTWPVWLSHALLRPVGDALVAWLVPAHPLFATNAVLIQFDTWDRHPLAYSRLTVLNQDVFYALPHGVLWAVLFHAAIGGIALGLTGWICKRSRGIRFVRGPVGLQVDVPDRAGSKGGENGVSEHLAPPGPRRARPRVGGRGT